MRFYSITLYLVYFYSLNKIGFACDDGWINYKNEKCIKVSASGDERTKSEAVQECKKWDSKVVTIHSLEQQLFVTSMLANQTSNTFIGLSRKRNPDRSFGNEYEWDDRSTLNFLYLNKKGSSDRHQGCIEMTSSGDNTGQWNHVHCDSKRGFICEKNIGNLTSNIHESRTKYGERCSFTNKEYTRYGDSCYKLYIDKTSWNEAENQCQQDHKDGHLVSIISVYEHAFIKYLTESRKKLISFWIGLKPFKKSSKIQWQWNDGWPLYYESWAKRENLSKHFNESCVVQHRESGNWTQDAHYNDRNAFICKINTNQSPGEEKYENAFCPDMHQTDDKNSDWINLYTKSKYCYWHSGELKLNWYNASEVCMQRNGTLMSLHSDYELLRPFMKSRSYNTWFWFGLFKNEFEEIEWEDGSKIEFMNWAENEPRKESGWNCGMVYVNDMIWYLIECEGFKLPFICGIEKIVPTLSTSTERNLIQTNLSQINVTGETSSQVKIKTNSIGRTSTERTSIGRILTDRIPNDGSSTDETLADRISTKINSVEGNKRSSAKNINISMTSIIGMVLLILLLQQQ